MNDSPTRLEQLNAILTSVIAMIVSEQRSLMPEKTSIIAEKVSMEEASVAAKQMLRNANKRKRSYKPKPDAFGPGLLESIDRREFRNGGKYYGTCARVAKKLHVSPGFTSLVACGKETSARIIQALVAEVRRIDATPDLSPLPLTASERAEFTRGGKYYGALTRVAKSLGIRPSNMHRVVRGKLRSPRTLAAVRAEMTRIDALPKEKRVDPLTPEEADQFKNGCKYYGLFTKVGKAMGRCSSTVGFTCTSRTASQSMLRCLRVEMQRVDAILAAKSEGK
jgi:hypothetical protein